MSNFLTKLWAEYPVPINLSIWGGDNITTFPIEDLNALLESMIDEIASDIFIFKYVEATGMITHMPHDCVSVNSAKLSGSFPFQGDRLVKFTYDKSSNTLYLRYFPATITYRAHLTQNDLDTLKGDRLNYILSFVLWKMATKELIYLRSVNMSVDNATVDLQYLQTFADNQHQAFKEYKEQILPYGTVV